MPDWSETELTAIGGAEELQIASRRRDGTLRPYVTIWVVRAGDDIYVRSAFGSTNPWFRRAKASGSGRIRAGVAERDVTFGEAAPDVQPQIDAAYHAKYDRHGPRIVAPSWGTRSGTSPFGSLRSRDRRVSSRAGPRNWR